MITFRTGIITFLVFIILLLSNLDSLAQSHREGKLTRSDVTLHYKIFGSKGDYVVILGGGPGSVVDYMQPIADSLSKNFQCIMLEQRGTGRSVLKKYDTTTIRMDLYIEDIEALRKHIKANQVILIGNSWGSMLSFLYGGAHPSHVSKIISLGAGPLTNKYAEIFDDNFRMRLLPHEREIRDFWKSKLKDSTMFVQANFERDKAGMPAYYYNRQIGLKVAMKLKTTDFNYSVFSAFDKAHPSFDLKPSLRKVTSSVLLVQGRQDLAGESNIIETHQQIKQSTLEFIERCGHIPWEEKPKETWKVVFSFLKEK